MRREVIVDMEKKVEFYKMVEDLKNFRRLVYDIEMDRYTFFPESKARLFDNIQAQYSELQKKVKEFKWF
jgi:hypothetical protein